MSVLSDRSIRTLVAAQSSDRLVITPFDPEAVQPASYDVRLGGQLLKRDRGVTVDPVIGHGPAWAPADEAFQGRAWMLWPGLLYLGVTLEYVEIPDNLLCHLHGRSSLARDGIVSHLQAGLVDPGYRGNLTLEITVTHATILRPGMPIGQLTFQRLTTPAEAPYGSPSLKSRYQGDRDPIPSRLGQPVQQEVAP